MSEGLVGSMEATGKGRTTLSVLSDDTLEIEISVGGSKVAFAMKYVDAEQLARNILDVLARGSI